MHTIILTSCVTPFTNVAISNPVQRLAEVLCAIVRWKHTPGVEKIIVADGSDFTPPESLGVEWFGVDLAAVARRFGKGRSEAMLIAAAVERYDLPHFWKITGRNYVTNFAAIAATAEGTQMAAQPSNMGIDTRCFFVRRDAWDRQLAPLTERIDDRSSSTFIERIYCNGAVGIREPLAEAPRYMGLGGTHGKRLGASYAAGIQEVAYERANRWLGKHTPPIVVAADGTWRRG
jgi:hypothetical protein